MTPEQELLHLAHQARLGIFHLDDGQTLEALTTFSNLVKAAEREACAQIAETKYRTFEETRKAHYRLSSDPFIAGYFGFDIGEVSLSRDLVEAIRARSES